MGPSSPSVLIIRLDAIGDALALTPLLVAFAQRGTPVDLVLREVNRGIFSSRAARHTFVAPFELRSSTRENLAAIGKFGEELKDNDYTHVIVATEDPGGYRLARAIGAPHSIGFDNGFGKPFKTLWAKMMLSETVHRTAGLDPNAPHECEVLFQLGEPILGDEMRPSQDSEVLRSFILEKPVEPGNKIVFQVTDKWERLGIAFEDVVLAMQAFALRGKVRAITAASEEAYADRIAVASRMEVEIMPDLNAWKDAIASAAMLVAPDSGALHLAGMLGTPVIAVFPPENFDLQVARWSPWASITRFIRADPGWPSKI